jgi:hypothetical protein
MLASFLVTTENLSDKPLAFQLADRIPVSETDEIRVRDVKLQPELKPDVKGLVKWDVTLPGKEKKEFRIEYTLDYPAELPVAAALSSAPASKGTPAAPTAAEVPVSEGLYQQIGDLEKILKK